MRFLTKKGENGGDEKNRWRRKPVFIVLPVFLACVFWLAGCGRVEDFLESPSKAEVSEPEDDAGKEEDQKSENAEEDSSENLGSTEGFEIEENQIEEGNRSLSGDELERAREEIGLSEAGIIGLMEAQSGNYYFEQLNSQEKTLYVECYQILAMQAQEILISTLDAEVLPRIYQCIINDHPEFFYLNGYTYTQYTRDQEIQYITFSGRYVYDAEEVARRQKLIDAEVDNLVSRLMGYDEYETVKRVYEELILSTDYSMDSPDNQNICSVFLDKKSVCNGYAKAAQYLLNDLGIPCIIVNGMTNGDTHAWNIVEIDGAYYHMDATWGDPSYYSSTDSEKEGAPNIDYSYLCVTDAEIGKNHAIDQEFTLPACTSTKDNYFVREGLYLNGYEEERIKAIFEEAKAQGKNTVTIKTSDAQAYQDIFSNLIEGQKIFDFFGTYAADGEYKIAYSGNEEMGTLSFWE